MQYVGVMDGELVAHTGIIPFPMHKGVRRVHRFVVLPDYQGIGIGMKFIDKVAQMIRERGERLNLTTTTPALKHALIKDPRWSLARYGRAELNRKSAKEAKYVSGIAASSSMNRVTYSFYYEPK